MNHRVDKISRRDLLRLTLVSPLAAAMLPSVTPAQNGKVSRLHKQVVVNSPFRIIPLDHSTVTNTVKLSRQWDGDFCRSSVTNTGTQAVRIKEIVLFEIEHALPAETRLYGEGFQMLSQTG